jgi:hypothetical protein
MTAANFARLDVSRPDVSRLVTAMLQARDAVSRRSWSHPQEQSSDAWWAHVLADPRARRREQRARCARLRKDRIILGSVRRLLRRVDRTSVRCRPASG